MRKLHILPFLILLGVILGCAGRGSNNLSASNDRVQAAKESVDAAPALKLLSMRWSDTATGNFTEVNGEVSNISDNELKTVRVIAEFRAKDGTLFTTEEGFLQNVSLPPRQTSSFKIIGRSSPEMATCHLRFMTFTGKEINHIDGIQQKPSPVTPKRKK
jgi:hypothetical protein